MVCQIVTDLAAGGQRAVMRARSPVARSAARVRGTRLPVAALHLAPTIPHWRAWSGNQTKLKAAFKQLLNVTMYEYVLQRRMKSRRRCSSRQSCPWPRSPTAWATTIPANFSCAFKRYYGRLPRDWKHE